MAKQINSDKTATWVYGMVEPGWYCARWTWDPKWAAQLEERGYRVQRSEHKPKDIPQAA